MELSRSPAARRSKRPFSLAARQETLPPSPLSADILTSTSIEPRSDAPHLPSSAKQPLLEANLNETPVSDMKRRNSVSSIAITPPPDSTLTDSEPQHNAGDSLKRVESSSSLQVYALMQDTSESITPARPRAASIEDMEFYKRRHSVARTISIDELPQPMAPSDLQHNAGTTTSIFEVFEDQFKDIRRAEEESDPLTPSETFGIRRSFSTAVHGGRAMMRLNASTTDDRFQVTGAIGGSSSSRVSMVVKRPTPSHSKDSLRSRVATLRRMNSDNGTVPDNLPTAEKDETASTASTPQHHYSASGEPKIKAVFFEPTVHLTPKEQREVRKVENTIEIKSAGLGGEVHGIKEEMGPNCSRTIVAGHLNTLFALLMNPKVDETYENFTKDFFLTFRYHSSEKEMWQALRNKFEEWSEKFDDLQGHAPPGDLDEHDAETRVGKLWIIPHTMAFEVLMRITTLMHMWLTEYSYLTFFQPPPADKPRDEFIEAEVYALEQYNQCKEVVQEIAEFVENDLSRFPHKQIRLWTGPIRTTLKSMFTFFGLTYSNKSSRNPKSPASDAPPFEIPAVTTTPAVDNKKESKTRKRTNAPFLSLNTDELFRQLTLIEYDLFRAVRPLDLMHKSKGKLTRAPKLNELIARFNNVSYWAATEICMCREVKVRAEVLRRFLAIAEMCFKYHNFNTCLQIVAALSMTCVQRLKITWKHLPSRYHTIWRNLSTTFSASKNYMRYRKEVLSKLESSTSSKPRPRSLMNLSSSYKNIKKSTGGIPFMGIHLSDLIYVEETAGKDRLSDGMINIAKMRSIADTFRRLVDLQRATVYNFPIEPFTRRFLMFDTLILDEDKLWKASRICEPPEHQPRPVPICRVNFTPSPIEALSEDASGDIKEDAVKSNNSLSSRVRFADDESNGEKGPSPLVQFIKTGIDYDISASSDDDEVILPEDRLTEDEEESESENDDLDELEPENVANYLDIVEGGSDSTSDNVRDEDTVGTSSEDTNLASEEPEEMKETKQAVEETTVEVMLADKQALNNVKANTPEQKISIRLFGDIPPAPQRPLPAPPSRVSVGTQTDLKLLVGYSYNQSIFFSSSPRNFVGDCEVGDSLSEFVTIRRQIASSRPTFYS